MGFCVLSECREMSLWDVLTWHRPKVTGVIFASLLLVLAFFYVMNYTLVTFLCRAVQLFLLLGIAASLSNRLNFTSDDIQNAVERCVDRAAPRVVAALDGAYRLVTWRDRTLSGAVVVASLPLGFLGNCLSDVALLTVLVVLAFTVPAVYGKKKDVIDKQLGRVKAQAEKYMGTIKTHVNEKANKAE